MMCPVQTKQPRILSPPLLAFAGAQAGLGWGYLDGGRALLIAHATTAFAVLVLPVLSPVFGSPYRRSGGPSWAFYLPLALLVAVVVQLGLGFAGVRGFHVFWGTLYLCGVTTYCSYSYRLLPGDRSRVPAGSRSA